jgi:hypothetical protein
MTQFFNSMIEMYQNGELAELIEKAKAEMM